jgi:hypothetical protein
LTERVGDLLLCKTLPPHENLPGGSHYMRFWALKMSRLLGADQFLVIHRRLIEC